MCSSDLIWNAVGIGNNAPIASLSIGNASVANQLGTISIAKNDNLTGNRQFIITYNPNFYMCLGDYGNANTASGPTNQICCIYNAPVSSLVIYGTGNMTIAGS